MSMYLDPHPPARPARLALRWLTPATLLVASCTGHGDEFDDELPEPDEIVQRLSGNLIFHETASCTLPQSVKDGVQDGWNQLFGTNGWARSDAFKKALSRQVFDQDLAAGASSCKSADPLDTTALPRDWSYASSGFDGLKYWNELLDGDGVGDGLFPPVGGGATRFDTSSYAGATTAELMYSLSNTTYDIHFHCADSTTMAAGPLSAGSAESYWLGKNISAGTSWYASTLIHEAMHNRRFDHSCGRPQVGPRTWDNRIDTSAANNGWWPQSYSAVNPPNAVEHNAAGLVFMATLMSRWNSDIGGTAVTYPDKTGPYPNGWANNQLLTFKGYDQVRLYLGTISTEPGFDMIRIYDDNDVLVATYSGEHEDVWTPWMDGPNLRIEFESDGSIPKACQTDYDCAGTFGGLTDCNQTTHMCVPPSDPDKSFMGYEVVTFEGRGSNNEHLIDLYRDSVSDYEAEDWDRLDTHLVQAPILGRTIASPNYLEPVPSGDDAVGDSTHSEIHATINEAGDVDVFRLWARDDGQESWTGSDRGYRMVFETQGSTDVVCRVLGPDGAGGFVEVATHDDISPSNRNCHIEIPVPRRNTSGAPYYYVEVKGYGSNFGDYTADFTTEVACDVADDGRLNDTTERAEGIVTLLDPFTGVWLGGVQNRTACVDSPRVFEFYYSPGTTVLQALFDDADGDLDLEVLDAAGNVVVSRTSPTDNEMILANEWPASMAAGTYAVRVLAYGNSAVNINTFDLQISS